MGPPITGDFIGETRLHCRVGDGPVGGGTAGTARTSL